MMIGPAPMIRMLWMSVRLGMTGCLPFRRLLLGRIAAAGIRLHALDHEVHEVLEQQAQIMRPGAGLGMPLKAEGRPVGARAPLQRAVEQRPVRGAQSLR